MDISHFPLNLNSPSSIHLSPLPSLSTSNLSCFLLSILPWISCGQTLILVLWFQFPIAHLMDINDHFQTHASNLENTMSDILKQFLFYPVEDSPPQPPRCPETSKRPLVGGFDILWREFASSKLDQHQDPIRIRLRGLR